MSDDTASTTAELVEYLDGLIDRLTRHSDSEVAADVQALLAGLDAVHRQGLTRLAAEIQAMAGDAFLHRLCQDPHIELLLMSYGLVSVNRSIQADEALDAVRPHLRSHGVDARVLEVVGGVVYVELVRREDADVDERAVRNDLETALREGFLGFQELQIGPRPWSPPAASLVQLEGPRSGAASFQDVAAVDELHERGLLAVEPPGGAESVLLLGDGEAVRAFRNRCGATPLPLHFSRLEGNELICSWHGCRYDPATGKRLDAPGEGSLIPVPVRVIEGRIQVALDGGAG